VPPNPPGGIGEAGLGILVEIVARQLPRKATAEVSGVLPGRRSGIEQLEHVGR
jgi:hypothetical protein